LSGNGIRFESIGDGDVLKKVKIELRSVGVRREDGRRLCGWEQARVLIGWL